MLEWEEGRGCVEGQVEKEKGGEGVNKLVWDNRTYVRKSGQIRSWVWEGRRGEARFQHCMPNGY